MVCCVPNRIMTHSGVRSVVRNHVRLLLLVALVTLMLLYIVSQDGASAVMKGKGIVTITLTKENVQGILKQEENVRDKLKKKDAQNVLEKQEVQNILNKNDSKDTIQEEGIENVSNRKNKRKKSKRMKKDEGQVVSKDQKGEQVVTEKVDQHVQYSEVEPVKNNTKKHRKKEREIISKKERPMSLSRYDNLPFVVVNNKVIMKKDLNSSAAQEALSSAGLANGLWPPVIEPSGASLLRQIDLSKYTDEDRLFLESRIGLYEERARHAGTACASFSDKTRNDLRFKHLVWDTKHKPNIVFCPNYKVASTTWMTNFLRLVHFNEDNPEIAKLPPKKRDKVRFTPHYGATQTAVWDYYKAPPTPKKKLKVFKKALRVIIVRHPFTRILSAYRDKMVKMKPKPTEFKFRDLQLQIIAKYREPNSDEKSPYPTFPEFVQHVIDSTANLTTSMSWQRNVHCWTPYWSQCEVCFSDFNFIMKLETMVDDERFLITMSDLKELKELKADEWNKNNKYAVTSYDVAPKFYQQLTQDQMRMLYQRYKLDFDIFDYTIDDYLAIAKY